MKSSSRQQVEGKLPYSIAGRQIGVKNMELKEVKCEQCGKEIYVKENYLREKMFCTLGCLGSYDDFSLKHNIVS